MPDLWMDVDAALAEVPVNIMPLLDDTDFKSIEASVAYNAAGMALKWNFVTVAGAYTQTAVTPTTAGDYDWASQGNGMYSIEIPASGGASINNDTEGVGWFTGVATGVLPWRGPTIGFRAAGLNDKLIESAYDTTRGLAGTALPAAAADAAGGLPISDAGGLDLDAQIGTDIDAILVDTGTTLQGELDGIQADTEDIQTRLPAALTGGKMESNIGSITAGVIAAASFAAGAFDAVWTVATRTLTAFDASFKTGYALSAAGVQAIWDALTSALTTVGSIGKLLVDNIDAAISSRLAGASYTTPPTVGEIADQVWDEAIAGHLGAGSTGAALNAAGSAGDPWTTPLPGAYGAGTAGKIVGDNLNATVGSRSSQTSVDDLPTNAELATALGTADDAVLVAIAALNNLSAAQVNTEVDTALADYDAPTKAELDAAVAPLSTAAALTTVGSNVTAIKAKTDNLPEGVKKNQALAAFPFKMVDVSDHVTGLTGLTVTATRSIDGGAFAACANSPTELASGVYLIDLAAADLNGTTVTLKFTASGADDTTVTLKTSV